MSAEVIAQMPQRLPNYNKSLLGALLCLEAQKAAGGTNVEDAAIL